MNKKLPFVRLSRKSLQKYVGSAGVYDSWSKFTYDKLTLNTRQNEDSIYRDILRKSRIGLISEKDIAILKKKKINLEGSCYTDCLQSLCNYIEEFPKNAVCLLPGREQCEALNSAKLSRM